MKVNKVLKLNIDGEYSFNEWSYKMYLFKSNQTTVGALILFKSDNKEKLNGHHYGITIIKGLEPKIGAEMIEIALSDTKEGIVPSEEKFLSNSAKKMWYRIKDNLKFKTTNIETNLSDKDSHSPNDFYLNKIYNNCLHDYFKINKMTTENVKELVEITSKELLYLGYKGTSNFVKNDLQKLAIEKIKKEANKSLLKI